MPRTCVVALVMLGVAAAFALIGCETVTVPYSEKIMVRLKETSGENPIQMTVWVDGQVKYGPATLAATEQKDLVIHDPAGEGVRLDRNQPHRITWEFHKDKPLGKAGNCQLTIIAGAKMVKTASSEWISPLFWWREWLNFAFEPGKAPPAGPPKTGP